MKKQFGFTLIETLLVLAIAGMIIVLGLRQYQIYRSDADVQFVNYDIDHLFQAMTNYYYANCAGDMDTNATPPIPDPRSGNLFLWAMKNLSATPPPPFAINITNDLTNQGFLTTPLSVNNPLVESYLVQFNENTPQTKSVNGTPVGTIITWNIQVAALVREPSRINALKLLLNADCVSDVDKNNPNLVTACESHPAPGSYLVFERPPKVASPNIPSGLETMSPVLQQFKQMYNTYGTSQLMSSSHSPEYQYYNCGT
jgi:prepilin-type N-terminal cleavage/methylation domain-containing protein